MPRGIQSFENIGVTCGRLTKSTFECGAHDGNPSVRGHPAAKQPSRLFIGTAEYLHQRSCFGVENIGSTATEPRDTFSRSSNYNGIAAYSDCVTKSSP